MPWLINLKDIRAFSKLAEFAATGQKIGYALLNTRFNTLTLTCQFGVMVAYWADVSEVWGSTPSMGALLIVKNFFCQLTVGKRIQSGKTPLDWNNYFLLPLLSILTSCYSQKDYADYMLLYINQHLNLTYWQGTSPDQTVIRKSMHIWCTDSSTQ